jgi:uncharacterized repeat protein (TIGR03803 family)
MLRVGREFLKLSTAFPAIPPEEEFIRRDKSLGTLSAALLVVSIAPLFGLLMTSGPVLFAQTRIPTNTKETVLYSFGGADGAGALSGVLAEKTGAFYGTTVFGGSAGLGLVFKLTPHGSGYRESVLYSFTGGVDGAKPSGLAAGKDGSFYGVTVIGGSTNQGTVFRLKPDKSGYSESVLYSFLGGLDGSQPVGTPVLGKDGSVYGVTQFGGAGGWGLVFKLTPSGSGYTKSTLYNFPGGAGGYLPQAGLTIDNHGVLYGTTYYGGDVSGCNGAGCGLIFKLAPQGSGYTESVLYRFKGNGDGALPYAAVTVDGKTGAIYGTTEYGGSKGLGLGTVFKLTPSGAGFHETVLHRFTGKGDGFVPGAPVLLRPNGVLYGVVALGGGGCNGIGCGAIVKLTPSGSDYSFEVIYDFGRPAHGADPENSTLIMDASGALFGTTRSGGSKTNCADGGPGGVPGCGTVFKIVP